MPAAASRPGNKLVELLEVVRLLEEAIGKPIIREVVPMQAGYVPI